VVFRRFWRDKVAKVSLVYLAFVVLAAVAAPLVALANGHPPNDLSHQFEMTTDLGLPKGPNWQLHFWLGADQFGRDLLTRTVYGARISLLVGVASTLVALVLGCAVGVVAGFRRGWVDGVLSRWVDVVLSFPILLLALAIRAVFGASLWIIIIVVAFATWPYISRIVRGQAMIIREQEYVLAARALGASDLRIMWEHVLPNLIGPLIVYGTLIIPVNILLEASLSYLGLGLPPPTATWGQMLADGQAYYATAPWMIAVPGMALLSTTIAFNLVGDSLRDALDPRTGLATL
jgi:ABC-type dipeptide/oligopeptide/nickel transport system permease subunit